jgi:hypothetical protein
MTNDEPVTAAVIEVTHHPRLRPNWPDWAGLRCTVCREHMAVDITDYGRVEALAFGREHLKRCGATVA